MKRDLEQDEVSGLLSKHSVNPTSQRVEIARLLFSRCEHLSAEDVFVLLNREVPQASKATVYNTLGLFAEAGLIREVNVDPDRVFYDPNTEPHHHFYNVSTGELMDIPANNINVGALPPLPEGTELEGVDVIVRVHSAASSRS